jgi:hypothetical protein
MMVARHTDEDTHTPMKTLLGSGGLGHTGLGLTGIFSSLTYYTVVFVKVRICMSVYTRSSLF